MNFTNLSDEELATFLWQCEEMVKAGKGNDSIPALITMDWKMLRQNIKAEIDL